MKIHLLGSPRVVLKSGQAASISSDSEHALLAYLAVDKSRDHQRESLSALLWPDTEAKQARSNLRVTLHRLRRALQDESGEIIQASKQALQLNWQADLWLDVDVFVQLLDEVDNHPHGHLVQCQPCADRLAEAVSLYQGDFLQGLIVEDSLLFQEWTIFNQEWLQRKMLAGLHQLTEIHIQQENFNKAERHARRQLELEPWREEAHRQLMRVLALRGERTAALAQYELCRKVLVNEFPAEPSTETRTLVEQIRSGQFQEKPRPAPVQPVKSTDPGAALPRVRLPSAHWQRGLLLAVSLLLVAGLGWALVPGSMLSRQTSAVPPAGQEFYDDFSNPAFEGAYDPGKWVEADYGGLKCRFAQQAGVLHISQNESLQSSSCTLRIKRPLAVTGSELGRFSSRMQLTDAHNGGFTGTVLRITTEFPGGGWAAACGILADFQVVRVHFDIVDLRLGEAREDHLVYEASRAVDYNSWLEIALELDDKAERITCYVDGQTVGEYVLPNSQELGAALLNREIGIWHDTDTVATLLLDEVVLGPGP